MSDEKFSRKEFLKRRRPDRFSDSTTKSVSGLNRSLLEYHLESLTSRSQENDFARFAHKLCEAEICPNLLPQTGPTGGGDSKVDSETFPVAEQLAEAWFAGINKAASEERWAFAFSAKEDWRSKVQSDVKKIAETNRGYRKAFFVTNQFVRDKARAEVEDELSKMYGLDVRILDRTWILDRVFANRHEVLASETLRLEADIRTSEVKGPRDTKREEDLAVVETRIKAALQEGRTTFQLVDDAILAASIARSLERPPTELDGMWQRAVRLAEKYGTSHQKVKAPYEWAWTSFWWHEDPERAFSLYDQVEGAASGSANVHDLELLSNLWTLLRGDLWRGTTKPETADFEGRTERLKKELQRFADDPERPSASLQAQTLLAMMELKLKPEAPEAALKELHAIIDRCAGLVGYPLEPIVEIIRELGDTPIGELPEYEHLFEKVVKLWSEREGEVSAGEMLVGRGVQQLDSGRHFESIRTIGRGLSLLYKDESRRELVRALNVSGLAYQSAGLLWAARGNFLLAASVETQDFYARSEVSRRQVASYRAIKWVELELGRVPQALEWHELHVMTSVALSEEGISLEELRHGDDAFDYSVGILMLRATRAQLANLQKMPAVLGSMDLEIASDALQFALGHEDSAKELQQAFRWDGTLESFFVRFIDQPAAQSLPATPSLGEGPDVELVSTVVGCQFRATCENKSPCIEVGETILAAIESILATLILEKAGLIEPVVRIEVRQSEFAPAPLGYRIEDVDGVPLLRVFTTNFDPHSMSLDAQAKVKEQIQKAIIELIATIILGPDLEDLFTRLFRDDRALERAMGFTGSFVVVGNVLGNSPKQSIAQWEADREKTWPVKRDVVWSTGLKMTVGDEPALQKREPKFGVGDPPPELLNRESFRHDDLKVVSPIRLRLWNRAGWVGAGFVVAPGSDEIPILALLFKDGAVGAQIFSAWRKELGEDDKDGVLRVTIIQGINRDHPGWYRIVISGNWPNTFDEHKLTISGARIHEMTPDTDANLSRFLAQYSKVGKFAFEPGILRGGMPAPLADEPIGLVKKELFVRQAWEIGRNDPDSVAIHHDDKPILPPETKNAPVLELLALKQRSRDEASE